MMFCKPARLLIAVVVAHGCLLAPRLANASPWTLPDDKFALSVDSNFQTADEEYLPDGTNQSFPLDGQFRSLTLTLAGRYGLTDRLEAAFALDFKQVDYEPDPVILGVPEQSDDKPTLNKSIVNFNQQRTGVGDMRLDVRYNFHKGLFMATEQTSLKVPAGYDPPNGTFRDDEFNPNGVSDDVALGDGQIDIAQGLLFGVYVPATNSFGRLDLEYVHRFESPGDQGRASLSLGQYLGDRVLIFAGARGAYTLFDGQSIGKSFITRTPEKPAGELGGEDIDQIPLTLDKDYINVNGGAILKFDSVEVRASIGQIVWGRNIPEIRTMSLGVTYAVDDLTGQND